MVVIWLGVDVFGLLRIGGVDVDLRAKDACCEEEACEAQVAGRNE